ncbi:MAG: DUF4019 domain-containing protein [Desulfamplus sp.]|nr:DUF4019 domain-containing protein [Desulfamplus sp.]
MNMKRVISYFVIVGLVLIGAVFSDTDNVLAEDSSKKEIDAVYAAQSWLSLVDSGKYSQSWEESSDLLKNAINKQAWGQTVDAVRKPLGRVISRKADSKTYMKSLPGVPDGEYVVIEFHTSFENKKSSVETVTPKLEKDGIWRVSGYFIK